MGSGFKLTPSDLNALALSIPHCADKDSHVFANCQVLPSHYCELQALAFTTTRYRLINEGERRRKRKKVKLALFNAGEYKTPWVLCSLGEGTSKIMPFTGMEPW